MILDDTCIKFMTDGVLLKEMEQVGTVVYSVVCVIERAWENQAYQGHICSHNFDQAHFSLWINWTLDNHFIYWCVVLCCSKIIDLYVWYSQTQFVYPQFNKQMCLL